jgi:hypothetical protein
LELKNGSGGKKCGEFKLARIHLFKRKIIFFKIDDILIGKNIKIIIYFSKKTYFFENK